MTDLNAATLPAAVTENWDAQKSKLIAKFPTLTDEDLQFEEGKKDEMLNRVQVKLGKTKEEIAMVIASL